MTSFSEIGIHRQYGPQIMTTIEFRGSIYAFIEKACIVSTTRFPECVMLNSGIFTK